MVRLWTLNLTSVLAYPTSRPQKDVQWVSNIVMSYKRKLSCVEAHKRYLQGGGQQTTLQATVTSSASLTTEYLAFQITNELTMKKDSTP